MQNKEIGIYIHIPFCKQKCYYCDFYSLANEEEWIPRYIKSLIEEIKYKSKSPDFLFQVKTINDFGLLVIRYLVY